MPWRAPAAGEGGGGTRARGGAARTRRAAKHATCAGVYASAARASAYGCTPGARGGAPEPRKHGSASRGSQGTPLRLSAASSNATCGLSISFAEGGRLDTARRPPTKPPPLPASAAAFRRSCTADACCVLCWPRASSTHASADSRRRSRNSESSDRSRSGATKAEMAAADAPGSTSSISRESSDATRCCRSPMRVATSGNRCSTWRRFAVCTGASARGNALKLRTAAAMTGVGSGTCWTLRQLATASRTDSIPRK